MSADMGRILSIWDIKIGSIRDDGERTVFEHHGQLIDKIRVLGTVIISETRDNYCAITLDDGTGIIQTKLWKQTEGEKLEYNHHLFSQITGIKIGDLIEVSGFVRVWKNERYISVSSLQIWNEIDIEINRRMQIIDDRLNSGSDKSKESLEKRILQLFQLEQEWTIEKISTELSESTVMVRKIIDDLCTSGKILQINQGIYSAL